MNVSPLERPVRAVDVPLESLAGNPQVSERQKIAEVSRQFEALVTRQILQQALKPVIVSKYTSSSTVNGIYQDMTTSQLADRISRAGGFGLADSLTSQLTRQLAIGNPATPQPTQPHNAG
jgi:Rod binding domain-containing protein